LRITWPRNGACYGRDELHDRLVRETHRVFNDTASENLGGDLLFFAKAAIEPIDQDLGVNEGGHIRRDPLSSILVRDSALRRPRTDACGGVRSLDRTSGVVTLDFGAPLGRLEE
jgi:hypothetical protein